jgi:hypothetical protein
METHVKVLAVLFIVFSALGTLGAFVVATVFGVAGVATAAGASGSDAAIALPIIGLAGTALTIYLLALSLPGLIAGIGLLKYKPWARILAIVLSALHLINFPIGTLLGLYALYVLLSDEGSRLFKPLPAATVTP